MAHLAPGGHFFLQVCFPAIFLFWLVFPADVYALVVNLAYLGGTTMTIGFITLATICYFVGVVLRLLPVDSIDDECAEKLMRRSLSGCPSFGIRTQEFASCWRVVLLPWNLKPLTVAQARRLARSHRLASQATTSEGVQEFLEASGELTVNETELQFRDWVLKDIGKELQKVWSRIVEGEAYVPSWPSSWVWMADRFPYPRFIAYRAIYQRGSAYGRQFLQGLWPELQKIIVAGDAATQPRQDFFNRCKLHVAAYCPAVSGEVSEREALVRMMAGFYQGLAVGLRGTVLVMLLSLVALVAHWFFPSAPNWVPAHSPHGLTCFLMLGLLIFVVNTWFWVQIRNRFHILRLSEAQAVFDSYLLANDYREQARQNSSHSPTTKKRAIIYLP